MISRTAALATTLAALMSCSDNDDNGHDLGASPDKAVTTDGRAPDQPTSNDLDAPDESLPDLLAPDTSFACTPPAKPGEIFALTASTGVRDISLCQFRGQVLLIVNIAAKCGYTPQLGKLATLYKTHSAQGLMVLGFYSNQFNQAGSEQEQQACEASYGVTFPTFPNVVVNPPNEDPVFTWLKAQPGAAGPVLWNFEKFLVSRDGKLLNRWATAVEPDAPLVTSEIQAALQSPP